MASDKWIKHVQVADGRVCRIQVELSGCVAEHLSRLASQEMMSCACCRKPIKGQYYVLCQYQTRPKYLSFLVNCEKCCEPVRKAIDEVSEKAGR